MAGLVALVVLATLAALVVLAALAGVALVVLAALAGLAALGGLAALAALAGGIACPAWRLGAAISGSTIPSIAAGLPTKTGQPQIALAERRVAILSLSARPAPGNKLAGKVATWPVPAEGLE